MNRPPTHYDTLNVSPYASADDIRDAYRALSRAYHPDRNPAPAAHAHMAAINAAYDVLSNAEMRAAYDRTIGIVAKPAAAEPEFLRDAPPDPDDRPMTEEEIEAEQDKANREFLGSAFRMGLVYVAIIAYIVYYIVQCHHHGTCYGIGFFRLW